MDDADRRRGERRQDYIKPRLDDPLPTHDAIIAGLASAAMELSATGQAVLSAFRTTRAQRIAVLALLILNTVAALAVIGGVAALIWIGNGNRDNTGIIRDCTTPGGVCYERGRAQTAEAVKTLRQYQVITVQCAHESTDAAIEACVERKALEQGLVK